MLGEGMRGVVLGDVQAMFDLTPENGISITEAAFQIGPDVQTVLITGLLPSANYRVSAEGNFNQRLTTNDAGLLVVEGMPSGTMRIALAE